MTLSQIIADTPQWVEDGKNYFGLAASFVGALGLIWRYGIKPYLVHREEERERALLEAAQVRQKEMAEALAPFQESMRLLQTDIKRAGDKVILQADAISGINRQIGELTKEQKSLHRAVREHMQAEDARGRDNGP